MGFTGLGHMIDMSFKYQMPMSIKCKTGLVLTVDARGGDYRKARFFLNGGEIPMLTAEGNFNYIKRRAA